MRWGRTKGVEKKRSGRTFEKPQVGLAVEALHERRVALYLPAHLGSARLVTLDLRPLLLLLEPAALAVGYARLLAERGDLALERGHRMVRVDPVGERVPRAGRVRVVRHRRRHGRVGFEERAPAPVVVPHAVIVIVRAAELHQASSARAVRDDGAFVVCVLRVTIFEQLGEDVREEHADSDTEKSTCTPGGIICDNEVDKETSADTESNGKGEKGILHENVIQGYTLPETAKNMIFDTRGTVSEEFVVEYTRTQAK
jgi:hypothetical protein